VGRWPHGLRPGTAALASGGALEVAADKVRAALREHNRWCGAAVRAELSALWRRAKRSFVVAELAIADAIILR
jgi:hypothetical protein